jgi:hypothetical protein
MKNYQKKYYMVKLKMYISLITIIINNYSIPRIFNFLINYLKIIKLVSRKFKKLDIKLYINAGESFEKYLDYKYWILENLIRIYNLNIDKKQNLKILDIGTGFGYFPFICEFFGNQAEAIDLDTNDMYNNVIKLLDIKRHTYCIEENKPLPLNTKFDIITGYMICFNNHKTDKLWGVIEWEYFLNSMKSNNLYNNGFIFFSFNLEFDEKPFSHEIKNLFMQKKAIIINNEVTIRFN